MTQELSNNDLEACLATAELLKKRVAEELLTEDEQRQIDNHLLKCTECFELVMLTSNLPRFAETLSDTEALFAINNVSNRYFSYRRYRKRIAASVLAIGALAACCAFFFVQQSLDKPKSEIASKTSTATPMECGLVETLSPVSGVKITFCGPNARDIAVDSEGHTAVYLRRGKVGCDVDPKRPHKRDVRVITKYGEVRVAGTMFTVRMENDDATVEVLRGSVEVLRAADPDETFEVAAGHGGSLRTKKLFSLTDSILDPLTLTQSRFDSFAIQPSDTHNDEGATIGGVTQVKPVDRADAGIGRTPAGGSSAFTASSETDLEFKAAAPSADELIRNAHTCLLHRDWECAAARYRQILKEYGNRSESVSALIGLARIELHYLNKPTQALAHFSTYEKRYPDGALTEEALLGIAESLRLLGRPEEEKASLRAFIERYPKSASIEKAKSRLKESAE